MTDMQRYGARGPLSDPPQLGEYVVVLASDAEAAITKIAAVSVEQILGSDEDTRAAIEQAYAAGQRDMLAKCIQKVSLYLHEEVCSDTCRGYCAALDDAISALRGLTGKEQP